MTCRSAIRVWTKWGALAATLLVLAGWLACERWIVFYKASDWTVGARPGGLTCKFGSANEYRMPQGWHVSRTADGIYRVTRPKWESQQGDTRVEIPFWSLAIVTAGVGAIVWRFDRAARRRAALGTCHSCGYDVTGLPPHTPCPECGAGRKA